MINILLTICKAIYNSIVSLLQLIVEIPLYYEQFKDMMGVVNIFNAIPITNILIVLVSIGIVIKIKRLVL